VKVAGALLCYTFGLCGYSGVKIATNGFYALKDMRTPALVSVFTIVLNIISNYVFIFQLGLDHRSLAISTSITITVNFTLVLWLLSRRVKELGWRDIVLVIIKSIIASTCMGIIAAFVYKQLAGIIGGISSLVIAMIISILILFVLYRLMKVREFNQIVNAVIAKIKR